MNDYQEYTERNANLKTLGFPDYDTYLRSDLWFSVRDRVFREKGRACTMCGEPATCVHHNRYGLKDLRGRRLTWLEPLCNGCHRTIEYDATGKKHSLPKVRELFLAGQAASLPSPKHCKPAKPIARKGKPALRKKPQASHAVKVERVANANRWKGSIIEAVTRRRLHLHDSPNGVSKQWPHWMIREGRREILWYYPHSLHWIDMQTKEDGYCEVEELVEILNGNRPTPEPVPETYSEPVRAEPVRVERPRRQPVPSFPVEAYDWV